MSKPGSEIIKHTSRDLPSLVGFLENQIPAPTEFGVPRRVRVLRFPEEMTKLIESETGFCFLAETDCVVDAGKPDLLILNGFTHCKRRVGESIEDWFARCMTASKGVQLVRFRN